MSLEQSSNGNNGFAPTNGTALGEDGEGKGPGAGGEGEGEGAGKAVPTGMVDALVSEKHGRWFNFNDRKVGVLTRCIAVKWVYISSEDRVCREQESKQQHK